MRAHTLVLTLLLLTLPVSASLALADDSARPDSEITDSPSLADLAWLAGHWVHQVEGRTSEEIWLPPTGNLMLGVNQTVHDGETRAFEFLRIERRATGSVYLASPGGREPTPFTLIAHNDMTVTFENPEHDFPQRIIYRREGDRLHARIEGMADGEQRSMAWSWDLVRD